MSIFDTLNAVNVNGKTEEKNGLTYLSWAWAWAEFVKLCPDATYEIVKYNGLPYVHDPDTGYMVYTRVTAGGITHEMWLPVMDTSNKAMKVATMFDINKTIMRCLTKNLAMFGLGLYIYAGEDLPPKDPEPINCYDCGAVIEGYTTAAGKAVDAETWAGKAVQLYGVPICVKCAKARQKREEDNGDS